MDPKDPKLSLDDIIEGPETQIPEDFDDETLDEVDEDALLEEFGL